MTARAVSIALGAALLAGCGGTASPPPPTPSAATFGTSDLTIVVPDLGPGLVFPKNLTCDGADRAPVVYWTTPPSAARRLTLEVYDPDAPGGHFVHWLVRNLEPDAGRVPPGGSEAVNGFGKPGWGGPCPPPGPPHHYHFVLSALDAAGRTVARAELVATYGR